MASMVALAWYGQDGSVKCASNLGVHLRPAGVSTWVVLILLWIPVIPPVIARAFHS